jgi:hypothetical protein
MAYCLRQQRETQMANVYLYTARYLLQNGYRLQACEYLALALGECNKDGIAKAQVLRAMSYARRA